MRFRYLFLLIAGLGAVALFLVVFKDVLFRGGTETILGARSLVAVVALVVILIFAVILDSRIKARLLLDRADRLAAMARDLYRKVDELEDANRRLVEGQRGTDATNRDVREARANVVREVRERLNGLKAAAREAENVTDGAAMLAQLEQVVGLVETLPDESPVGASVEFDPAELTMRLGDAYRKNAEAKGLEFEVEVQEGLPAKVTSDAVALRDVLANLLDNAVKFTDSGSVKFILARVDEDRYKFKVVDTGIGMPKEGHERLFEPFVQGPGANLRGGIGLGLAIAARSAAQLGTNVNWHSTPGGGSCFSVELLMPVA